MKNNAIVPILALILPLSGCAVFQALGEGLSALDRQTAGSPVFYAASTRAEEEPNSLGDPVATSYFIDKVSLVDGRDGAAFRFEALRRARVPLDNLSFEGFFTALSVRPDGRFLAVTAEEDLSDTVEGHMLIYRTSTMAPTLFQTDATLPAQALTACDIGAASGAALQDILDGLEGFDLQQPYSLTWQTTAEDAFPLQFVGWSPDNRAVFRTFAAFEAVVIQNGDAFLGPDGIETFLAVDTGQYDLAYRPRDGRVLRCSPAPMAVVAPFEPDDRLRTTRRRVSTIFTVTPAEGGDFPLYALLASSANPARFFIPGVVDAVAGPIRSP